MDVGGVVGLKHKGRDSTNASTRLEVLTDGNSGHQILVDCTDSVSGSLIAAAKNDPSLQQYGAIVIDEAHQHTVPTDLLLGLLKELAAKRKDDLKIIIMSATIDAGFFLNFFPGSVLEEVSGREHQVLISYTPEPPEQDAIVETILQVHLSGRNGNILVFVPGTGEIFKIIQKVKAALEGPNPRFSRNEIGPLDYWPLYAQLPSDEQDNAIESVAPVGGRELIVATNIAETSVTLTGVTHVIDSCMVKNKSLELSG